MTTNMPKSRLQATWIRLDHLIFMVCKDSAYGLQSTTGIEYGSGDSQLHSISFLQASGLALMFVVKYWNQSSRMGYIELKWNTLRVR